MRTPALWCRGCKRLRPGGFTDLCRSCAADEERRDRAAPPDPWREVHYVARELRDLASEIRNCRLADILRGLARRLGSADRARRRR